MEQTFCVSFSAQSIKSIKMISQCISKHRMFFSVVYCMKELQNPIFATSTEKKLGMFIILNNADVLESDDYVLRQEDVMKELTRLLCRIFYNSLLTISENNESKDILDGYALKILSNICGTLMSHTRIIGESVRKFVKTRDIGVLPPELFNVIEGSCPLVDHPNSPLNKEELIVVYDYIGSRKNIYVHILLNCLYEMAKQCRMLSKSLLTE